MNVPRPTVNLLSPVFWTTIAGIAGTICGAINVGNLSTPVETVITAIGGLLVAITGYHTVKAATTAKSTSTGS